MMRQAIQSTKFMQAIIAALIAGGMIFWIGAEMGKPAGREDLKVEVVDIRSNVSEAAKVIEAATYGRLTAKYFLNKTAMLQENLAKTSKTLGSAKVEPGLEAKFAEARQLAESAATELGRLSSSFGDKQAMEESKAKLAEIFERTVTVALETLLAANLVSLLTCAAEVGGIAIILRLILGWPYRALILIGFLFLLLSVWFLSFKWIERVFGLFGLLMTVFIVSAFYLRPDWGQVASSFIPHVPRVESRQEYYSYAYFVIALLSSIMLPYETYFYASGAIEDRWEPKHIKLNRVVVIIGFTLGSVLSAGLILIGAQMFLPTKLEPNLPGAAALGPAMTFGKTGLIVPLLVITHGGKE